MVILYLTFVTKFNKQACNSFWDRVKGGFKDHIYLVITNKTTTSTLLKMNIYENHLAVELIAKQKGNKKQLQVLKQQYIALSICHVKLSLKKKSHWELTL